MESMAFPVPAHLPRKGIPQDISSQILSKISSTSSKSLNAELAQSWIAELDENILQSKTKIHERINADLPAFEEQLEKSKSIQERLLTLTTNVDELNDAVANPETGLVHALLLGLAAHAALNQQAKDAEITHESLEHLLRCRTDYDALEKLIDEGRLPEAVDASAGLENVLNAAPVALAQSEIVVQLRSKFRALKDRVEEQLGDAYARSIVISSREIIIRPSVQVRQSLTILELSSIFSSLSPTSLSNHLSTLRRDITAHYIDYILTQPTSLAHSFAKDDTGMPQHRLSIFPSPPNSEDRSARLENLATIFDFLDTHLFPAIPPSQLAAFKQTLCKPVTKALLQHFLIPLLPSSLTALPPFLQLVHEAVEIEGQYVLGMLGQDARDREIKVWAESVSSHYERKRRAEILEGARQVIARVDEGGRFGVEVDPLDVPAVAPSNSNGSAVAPVVPEPKPELDVDAWGLQDDAPNEAGGDAPVEDGWGFDEEAPESPEIPASAGVLTPAPAEADTESKDEQDDASDAWGWDDDTEPVDNGEDMDVPATSAPAPASSSGSSADDSSVWDDPWGAPEPPSSPISPSTAPKPATRLEKLANKGKWRALHTPQSSIGSAPVGRTPPSTPDKTISQPFQRPQKVTVVVKGKGSAPVPPLPPPPPPPPPQKETYLASVRARDVADIVEAALREGSKFASSSAIFADMPGSTSSTRGTLLLQTAPSIVDLFRALYPVKFDQVLTGSAEKPMLFANDCIYLARRITHASEGAVDAGVKDKLSEAADRLVVLGESWHEQNIERHQALVSATLNNAQGFADTSDQERFDDCESAVTKVLSQIRTVARQWKIVLSNTKYLNAIGVLVDTALVQMLGDILALPDVTEVESHRLSELCRILHALEGLFMEDLDQPSSVVAYVPSWLKFSYLSELLEASLADISYLFDEGALVDYEVQELVKLVRALFAETPQRANMTNKLISGHPHPR